MAAKKITVECAECDKSVELTEDEETGQHNGRCGNCGLDMGEVYDRDRGDRALARLREKREKAANPKGKEKRHRLF